MLEARCRRNGLSRLGGRGAQVARLLALAAYLGGDVRTDQGFTSSALLRAAPEPFQVSWQALNPKLLLSSSVYIHQLGPPP